MLIERRLIALIKQLKSNDSICVAVGNKDAPRDLIHAQEAC